jgi:hypothetical protein
MKQILRGVGWIACWFIVVCIGEVMHGIATGLGLLAYPGEGVWGAVDWFIVVVSVLPASMLYVALRDRRLRAQSQSPPQS